MMEVCVDCVRSAVNGCEGGAARLELCSALTEGGLTPSVGLLAVVKRLVSVPVFCMVRPRSGEDFLYNDQEIEAMKHDIEVFKQNGADGLVFGCLTRDRKVDVTACKQLMDCVGGKLPVTFHRAFDYLEDPYEGLETLIDLGFQRVLTSGQAVSVDEGIEVIKELVLQAKQRIIVMPGGGINESNLKKVLQETNAVEFHGSARIKVASLFNGKLIGSPTSMIMPYIVTDLENVRRLVLIAQQITTISKHINSH